MARRVVACLAAALTAAVLAGCVRTVTGRGTYAGTPAGAGVGSAGGPSGGSPSGSGDSSSEDETRDVCAALDRAAVERLFGASVGLKKSQGNGCQLTGSNGKSMIVAVFDYLTLSEHTKASYRKLRVGGHPAVSTDASVIYVARSADPEDDGLLAAYFSGLGENGDRIAIAVLQQLLRTFSR